MITIELKDEGIERALASIARALTDMTPLMEEIGDTLLRSSERRILEGETPAGSPFAPRSETTLELYASRKPPLRPRGGPLDRTGVLAGTLARFASSDRVEIGSNQAYAAAMHFGASQGAFGATSRGAPIPYGDIPARPFLGISAEDRTNILDAIAEWLERAARGGS